MRFEPYLPHFQQGLCLYHLGRFDAALEAWKESEDQGAIDHRKNKHWRRTLEDLKFELNRALPQLVDQLIAEVAEARGELLRQRESVSGISDPLVSSSVATLFGVQKSLDAAAELLMKDIVLAGDTGHATEMIRAAWETLTSTHDSIRDLGHRQEERQAEAARQAAVNDLLGQLERVEDEIALAVGCPLDAEVKLARIMATADRLTIDLVALGRSPHHWMTRASAACGKLEEARLHLEEARSETPSEIPALEEFVRKAAAAAEWNRRYTLARRKVATGVCDAQLEQELASLESRTAVVASPPSPTPRLLIATSALSCQRLGEAEKELAIARQGRLDPPERIAQVAERLAEVKREAERKRRHEALSRQEAEAEERRRQGLLVAGLQEIENLLSTELCQKALLVKLETKVSEELVKALSAMGLSPARPYLVLARGFLACGELEDSRHYIARAQSTTTDSSQEQAIASIVEAIETADQERALQAKRRKAIIAFVAAVSRIEAQCDRSLIDEIDQAHTALDETTTLMPVDALEAELGIPYTPFLYFVRLYLACGDQVAARGSLRQARNFGRAAASTLDYFENLLSRDERLGIYSHSYALLVGAVNYTNGWGQLPGVKVDIESVRAVLELQGFEVEIVWSPTKEQLTSKLEDFIAKRGAKPDNRLIVYYAGHGWTEKNFGMRLGYIVPVDSPLPGQENYLRFLVSMEDFEKHALEARAKDVVFIFDSCFSGTMFNATKTRLIENTQVTSVDDLLSSPARLFLTAGDEQQKVPDESVFRVAIVAGLGGNADYNLDGLVLGRELGRYVVEMGQSTLSSPKWGVLDHPSFLQGDVGFKALKMKMSVDL